MQSVEVNLQKCPPEKKTTSSIHGLRNQGKNSPMEAIEHPAWGVLELDTIARPLVWQDLLSEGSAPRHSGNGFALANGKPKEPNKLSLCPFEVLRMLERNIHFSTR